MIKSMTGYGRAEALYDKYKISLEIKSVNHRYFEFGCRIGRAFSFLEDRIRSRLSELIARGKVDVFVNIERIGEAVGDIEVNFDLAGGYLSAINEISDKYGVSGEVSALWLSRMPDVVSLKESEIDEEEVWGMFSPVLDKAAEALNDMRQTEGEKMYKDITGRCEFILDCVSKIEALYPESVKHYRERLEERMKELLGDAKVDEQRLITETAIMADRLAVDEETVRLRSHISQLKGMLEQEEPTGRKMDFIVQEMNREINTVGSKSQNIDITKCVVDVKSEIEKIREQVQNIQ